MPELAADEFFFLLEGAKSCVQCIGLKRVGQHLMRLVDTIVAEKGGEAEAEAGRGPLLREKRPRAELDS